MDRGSFQLALDLSCQSTDRASDHLDRL
jgi:hypothetical protein